MENTINTYKELFVLKYISGNLASRKMPLKALITDLEVNIIKKTLHLSNGNQRNAAKILGIGFTTFNEKIKRYKIEKLNIKSDMIQKVNKIIENTLQQ